MSLVIEEIKADIRDGKIVVMVGTGVSLAATGNHAHASWNGLLESGVEYCRRYNPTLDAAWEERVRDDIQSPRMEDLLSAAERISTFLGGPTGGNFRKWLKETVGRLRPTDRSVLVALRDLGLPLATTNYDGLLEEETVLLPITWRDTPLAIDWLRGNEPGIFHWHGFWREPESVVLGIRSYQQIIGNQRAQDAIRALLATKVFLFVGFGAGLRDPNFAQLRKWMAGLFAGVSTCHYRLAVRGELEQVESEHEQEEWIKVVDFGERYEDLAPFLCDLRPSHPWAPAGRTDQAPVRSPRIPPKRPCHGRKELIDHLADAVAGDARKPIPLLGGPALGKTTVAIATLHDSRVVEKFGDRRYYVTCNGARSRADLVAKIAQELGVAHSPYPEDVVLATLGSKPAVLALDDAEMPLDADRDGVQELLARLAAVDALALLAILRGAQRPLHLEWHQAIHVLPLDPADAREAFLRVAGSEYANDPLLDSLLEAVGCVPYSVMILGYLAQAEPDLRGLWNRWRKERTKLLRSPGVSEEFQKMAASFEVSISAPCVDEAARRLLAVLGMLPDGIVATEVAQVFPHLGEAACATLRRAALVFAREPRLRLHGLLREHVREKYPPHPDDLRRAVKYYARLAVADEAQFGGRASDQAVSRFAASLGNIEAVIQAAFHGEQEPLALDAAAALAAFISLTGAGSRDLVRTAEGLQGSMNPDSRARLLRNCADLETRYGNRERAYGMYEAGCDLFKSVGDMDGAADCIKKIADLEREAGSLEESAAGYQLALDVQGEPQNVVLQAGCAAGLGDIAMLRESYYEARSHFEHAFRLCLEAENHAGMAYCRMRLGYVSLAQKGSQEALQDFEQAIPLAAKAHDLLIEASAMQGLGTAEMELSDPDRAERYFEKALRFFERVDDTFGIGGCLRGLGDVAKYRLDNGRAWQLYLDALQIYHRGPHWRDIGDICARLASVASGDDERRRYKSEAQMAHERVERAPAGERHSPVE